MSSGIPVGIASIGHNVPDRVLTNDWFAQFIETSDEWVQQRTGIVERRWMDEGETTSDIFVKASVLAMERAGVKPEEIDLIVCGTISGDYLACPATACVVQDRLGCKNAWAFDLSAACTGFIYSLQVGRQFIMNGSHKNVLVIGGEGLSRVLDMHDRNSVVIFADGGGAAILQPHDKCQQGLIEDMMVGADGSGAELIIRPKGGAKEPVTPEILAEGTHMIRMKGREVYRFAVDRMTALMAWAMEGQDLEELGWVFPHQMNRRILETASGKLDIPREKVYINIQRFGNTSAGTVPICLGEAWEKGLLESGKLQILAAFGAGLTWGAARIRW
jgi:3-oxoacyl-[acyl-carrier-protein] synthase III